MIPSAWFPYILIAHISFALSLFLPSFLLPFTMRNRTRDGGGPGQNPPGPFVRGLMWLERNGTLFIGIGVLVTGILMLSILGAAFANQPWLLAGIAIYAGVLVVSFFIQRPGLRRLIGLSKDASPEEAVDGAVAGRVINLSANSNYGHALKAFHDDFRGGVTRRTQVKIYGHSAGGQFLHRLLATQEAGSYEAAMAGNPGWYTLPTLERPFPEGLGNLGLDERAIARWLAYPMTILAGDQDIATEDPNLPSNPEALAQGPHRFGRAHFMYEFAKGEAARRGLPCNWQLTVVPGIGHDGAAMSRAAAALWFENRLPGPEELGKASGAPQW